MRQVGGDGTAWTGVLRPAGTAAGPHRVRAPGWGAAAGARHVVGVAGLVACECQAPGRWWRRAADEAPRPRSPLHRRRPPAPPATHPNSPRAPPAPRPSTWRCACAAGRTTCSAASRGEGWGRARRGLVQGARARGRTGRVQGPGSGVPRAQGALGCSGPRGSGIFIVYPRRCPAPPAPPRAQLRVDQPLRVHPGQAAAHRELPRGAARPRRRRHHLLRRDGRRQRGRGCAGGVGRGWPALAPRRRVPSRPRPAPAPPAITSCPLRPPSVCTAGMAGISAGRDSEDEDDADFQASESESEGSEDEGSEGSGAEMVDEEVRLLGRNLWCFLPVALGVLGGGRKRGAPPAAMPRWLMRRCVPEAAHRGVGAACRAQSNSSGALAGCSAAGQPACKHPHHASSERTILPPCTRTPAMQDVKVAKKRKAPKASPAAAGEKKPRKQKKAKVRCRGPAGAGHGWQAGVAAVAAGAPCRALPPAPTRAWLPAHCLGATGRQPIHQPPPPPATSRRTPTPPSAPPPPSSTTRKTTARWVGQAKAGPAHVAQRDARRCLGQGGRCVPACRAGSRCSRPACRPPRRLAAPLAPVAHPLSSWSSSGPRSASRRPTLASAWATWPRRWARSGRR